MEGGRDVPSCGKACSPCCRLPRSVLLLPPGEKERGREGGGEGGREEVCEITEVCDDKREKNKVYVY